MSALVGALCACLRCDLVRASQRVEEAEVSEIYRKQDEEHDRQLREKAEKEAARRAALTYVIQVVYFGTPVSTRLQKYPEDSAKAGQKYVWVQIDEWNIEKGNAKSLRDGIVYPPGCKVDGDGTIYVSATPGNPARTITPADLKAAEKLPGKVSIPVLVDCGQTHVSLRFSHGPGIIDRFELQYQPHETNNGFVSVPMQRKLDANGGWITVSSTIPRKLCTAHDLPPDFTACFRVRAHSMKGWGPWSDASLPMTTLPGPPSRPAPPTARKIGCHSVKLTWSPSVDNGSPVEMYELRAVRKLQSPRSSPKHFSKGFDFDEEKAASVTSNPGDIVEGKDAVESPIPILAFEGHEGEEECAARTTSTVPSPKTPSRANSLSNSSSPSFPALALTEWSTVFSGEALEHTVVELKAGVAYFFQLRALNGLGYSPWSASSCYKTHDVPINIRGDAVRVIGEWGEFYHLERDRMVFMNTVSGIIVVDPPAAFRRAAEADSPEILFRKKRFRLMRRVRRSIGKGEVLQLMIRRSKLLEDSFEKFAHLDTASLGCKLKIEYEGEAGIDSGGLSKDWFLELSRRITDKQYCLFQLSKQNLYQINPRSGVNDGHLDYFRFFGRFVAKALIDQQLLDMQFDRIFYKQLLQQKVLMRDLKEVDPSLHKSLNWILENDITDVIYETFSVTREEFGCQIVVDLVEGGRNVDVDESNKGDYVQLMVDYFCHDSVSAQIEAFHGGFHELVPPEALQNFSVTEFTQLLNGKPDFDVAEIRDAARYSGGYNKGDTVVSWLWEILEEWDQEMRSKLLRFVTGTTKVPLDGLQPPMNVVKGVDMELGALPRTHTCFNQLVFPPYLSKDFMKKKLEYAILNTQGFELS